MMATQTNLLELRTGRMLVAAAAALLVGCSESNGPQTSSGFTAEIRGSRHESVTGTAVVVGSSDDTRHVLEVTVPGVGAFAGVYLTTADRTRFITLFRPGADLPAGTFRVGVWAAFPPTTPDIYSGSYVVRRADGAQTFVADSGTVTITQTGVRVSGTFTLYVDRYDVFSFDPPSSNDGRTTTESGRAPMTISGSFDAARPAPSSTSN